MNNNYLDYGRKIPGAKKDKFNRTGDDINLNYSKNDFWEKPKSSDDDYLDYVKNYIRNSVRKHPRDNEDSIRYYKAAVENFGEAINEMDDVEEIKSFISYFELNPDFKWNEVFYRPIKMYYLSEHHFIAMEERKLNRKVSPKRLKPQLRKLKREGEDYRHGAYITTEKFAETFGISGVQFGTWVSEKERRSNITNAYDALKDLAYLLDIPDESIGLNSKLAIAFGARGSGRAAGHYEPDQRIINLTKLHGQGVFAHEWFHSLDHILGIVFGNGELLSNNCQMFNFPIYFELSKVINNPEGQYYKDSVTLDLIERRRKRYWTSNSEMFARAFQAYITDKQEEKGIINEYLNTETIYYGSQNQEFKPYPSGIQRKRINELFDQLFEELKQKFSNPIHVEKVALN